MLFVLSVKWSSFCTRMMVMVLPKDQTGAQTPGPRDQDPGNRSHGASSNETSRFPCMRVNMKGAVGGSRELD